MRSIIMRREFNPCWALVPYMCRRIEDFDSRYQVDGGASGIAEMFKTAFATGETKMLVIAMFSQQDGLPKLSGHLVAGMDYHHGKLIAVIYQYEKDEEIRNDPRLDDEVQALVDNWTLSMGQTEVSALAISPGRMRHFKRWGYRYTATLITRRVTDGRQGVEDQHNGSDDSTGTEAGADAVAAKQHPEDVGASEPGVQCSSGE